MITKENIIRKIERIESSVNKLNHSIGTNERATSYVHLDSIKENLSDILTFLNRETQD